MALTTPPQVQSSQPRGRSLSESRPRGQQDRQIRKLRGRIAPKEMLSARSVLIPDPSNVGISAPQRLSCSSLPQVVRLRSLEDCAWLYRTFGSTQILWQISIFVANQEDRWLKLSLPQFLWNLRQMSSVVGQSSNTFGGRQANTSQAYHRPKWVGGQDFDNPPLLPLSATACDPTASPRFHAALALTFLGRQVDGKRATRSLGPHVSRTARQKRASATLRQSGRLSSQSPTLSTGKTEARYRSDSMFHSRGNSTPWTLEDDVSKGASKADL